MDNTNRSLLAAADGYYTLDDITDIRRTHDPRYLLVKYQGIDVVMSVDNNYINISELCFRCGSTAVGWLAKDSSIELISELSANIHKSPIDIKLGETFAHPNIMEDIVVQHFSYYHTKALEKNKTKDEIKQLLADKMEPYNMKCFNLERAYSYDKILYAYILKTKVPVDSEYMYDIFLTFDKDGIKERMKNAEHHIIYECQVPTTRHRLHKDHIIDNLEDPSHIEVLTNGVTINTMHEEYLCMLVLSELDTIYYG